MSGDTNVRMHRNGRYKIGHCGSSVISREVAMWQSVEDAFFDFTTPLEGRVHFMYLDIKSLVSTGIGNLLDNGPSPLPDIFTVTWFHKDTGAIASNADIQAEYTLVKNSGTAFATLPQKEAITTWRISDD